MAAEVAMSWSFDDACLWNFDGGTTHTVAIDGVRWFAIVSPGHTSFVAAPASLNDGEARRAWCDEKLVGCIDLAHRVACGPAFQRVAHAAELQAWCQGDGLGELFDIKVNRALLMPVVDAVKGASRLDGPVQVCTNRALVDGVVIAHGDAIGMLMGIAACTAIPPLKWPYEVA